MKCYSLRILLTFNAFFYFGQKSASALVDTVPKSRYDKASLDTSKLASWPEIDNVWNIGISNDGKYAMYQVKKYPSSGPILKMVIRELNSQREIELPAAGGATFTNNSQQVFCLLPSDSLCKVTLANGGKHFISNVKSFNLLQFSSDEYLIYQLNNADKELIIHNLSLGSQQVYKGIEQYSVSANGKTIVVKCRDLKDSTIEMKCINIINGLITSILKEIDVNNVVLSATGDQCAFMSENMTNGDLKKVCWYYKEGTAKANSLAIDQSSINTKNLEFDKIDGFSEDGNKLFIRLKEKRVIIPQIDAVNVNIWSYTDSKLQTQQLFELRPYMEKSYLAVISLENENRLIQLQEENESIVAKGNDYVVTNHVKGDWKEMYWNRDAQTTSFIISANTGKKEPLRMTNPMLSPNEKYVIGFDWENQIGNWFSYEITTGIIHNITNRIPNEVNISEHGMPLEKTSRRLSPVAWIEDNGILFYDDYDIWQVDVKGERTPINLTKGKSENLVFRIAGQPGRQFPLHRGDTILLKVFSKLTKECSFYQLKLNKPSTSLLYRANAILFDGVSDVDNAFDPIKARDVNVYLVSRQQADMAPNIFCTKDFKNYISVSNIQPEKDVNWYKSELIMFKTEEGVKTQAILYKPEDYDPEKRYPLIIQYYDKKSDGLNRYRYPAIYGGELDVAWFVSHGYMVCLTDIHYKIGETGESVRKSVEGAARFLSQRSYIDKNHIGIQGHSFGGFETNYLVTHSRLFAAAVSSSGPSDLAMFYSNVWFDGTSKQHYAEVDRMRLGSAPWQKPELYIKNSPIYHIEKVNMPVLLQYNRDDKNVEFEHGLQFFTALRRAGKRVWMLEYDNGGHGLFTSSEYKDNLIRTTQFFDHYLKDAPAPRWMLNGVPAKFKGINDGLELIKQKDKNGKWVTPGPGLLNELQNIDTKN